MRGERPTYHFGSEHFGTKVSSREHFGTCTLWPCGRSDRGNVSTWGLFESGNFRLEEFLAPWTFSARDISAPDHFGIWIFWHLCYCAEMSMCGNVAVPQCSCAENSSCQKVPMSKCSRVERSICQNVSSAEWCTSRNVSMMKHLCRNDSCRNVLC